ncbi:MAG: oligosaccharide flippase family protein [Thermodesulfobacteriota bacterium]
MLLEAFKGFIGDRDSLRYKTILGSQWQFFKSVAIAFIELAKAAVFARVLFPDDYGLMALAMIAIGLLEAVSATGIELMIQSDADDYLEKIPCYWTIRLIRGVVIFAVAWLTAVPMAEYYRNPAMIPLIQFLSITFLIQGVSGFGREIRQRQMEFSRILIVDVLSALVTLLIGLVFLFWLKNVWALAAYAAITALTNLITSYYLFPWRPTVRLDVALFKKVVIFSGSIVFINFLNYLFSNLDRGVIGKILGLDQLGYYARGHFLALVPATYFFNAIGPVLLQAFRQVADDVGRFRSAFIKSTMVYVVVSVLIGLACFVFSKVIIWVIYGEKWLPAVPVFKVLIIFGISKGIVSVCAPVFFIRDRPWLITLCLAVMIGCFAVLCYPLTLSFGILGTAWAVVVSAMISHGLSFVLAFNLISDDKLHQRF